MAKKAAVTREDILEQALSEIRGKFGDGAIMRLGDEVQRAVEVIPSGILPLDVALGIGGVPRGRVVEIFGPEGEFGDGKTRILDDKGNKTGNKIVLSNGGHYKTMIKEEKNYYKELSDNNLYKDTQKSSLLDFIEILELCYKNDIELDIVFGPSHIRQWEAFDYYKDYETLLTWKKDLVEIVQKVANKFNNIPFRIVDFAVYNEYTSEKIPTEENQSMVYHYEGSHYKPKLGEMLLKSLSSGDYHNNFGVELNNNNIDSHLQKLREDRNKFINTKEYRKEVFGE